MKDFVSSWEAAQCSPSDITQILLAWNRGAPDALEALVARTFADLHRIAASLMKGEREDHILEPTALVHELYLRLAIQRKTEWKNRMQFFGFAAQIMRKILIDHARRRRAEKRGEGAPQKTLEEISDLAENLDVDLVRLSEALQDLERLDPRRCRIVELRFFAGLSIEEVEKVLGCSRATVIREWRAAKSWLLHYLLS